MDSMLPGFLIPDQETLVYNRMLFTTIVTIIFSYEKENQFEKKKKNTFDNNGDMMVLQYKCTPCFQLLPQMP